MPSPFSSATIRYNPPIFCLSPKSSGWICILTYLFNLIINLVAQSKAWVCGRWLAGIVVLNAAGGMEVCLL